MLCFVILYIVLCCYAFHCLSATTLSVIRVLYCGFKLYGLLLEYFSKRKMKEKIEKREKPQKQEKRKRQKNEKMKKKMKKKESEKKEEKKGREGREGTK